MSLGPQELLGLLAIVGIAGGLLFAVVYAAVTLAIRRKK